MVTNDVLRRIAVWIFYTHAHTIYMAKILWVEKLCIGKRS
jgi:hypothetical protein